MWSVVPAICWMRPRVFGGMQHYAGICVGRDRGLCEGSTGVSNTTRSSQAAHLHPPTPCAAPPFVLHCCSISAPGINPHQSLSPSCAGSPFRELSQITAPPALLVRLTFTLLPRSYLYACLRCMALSFHPHPLIRFCMFSKYPI